MENNYTVYMHISPSDKRYIGITSMKPNKRWQNGKGYKHNKYFTRAINKYGWDNFQHIIVVKGLDEETAKWLEIKLIREWDTTNRDKGYNMTLGGDGVNGYKHTEEEIQKMSKALSGKNHWNYGQHHTEKAKEKMSKAKCGENNPMFGKSFSEETIKKISGENNSGARKVICITTNKIFNTIKEGGEYYNCSPHNITNCCRGKLKSCGKLCDGTKLIWLYYEDYLKMNGEIDNEI